MASSGSRADTRRGDDSLTLESDPGRAVPIHAVPGCVVRASFFTLMWTSIVFEEARVARDRTPTNSVGFARCAPAFQEESTAFAGRCSTSTTGA